MISTWMILAAGGALLGIGKQAPLRIAVAKLIELANARQPNTPAPAPQPGPDVTTPPEREPNTIVRDKQVWQLQLLRIAEFGAARGNTKLATQAFSVMKLLAETPTETSQ